MPSKRHPRSAPRVPPSRTTHDSPLAEPLQALGILVAPRHTLAARGEIARQLIHDLGGLRRLSHASPALLCRTAGISPRAARRIHAAMRLGHHVHTQPLHPKRPIRSSEQVAAAFSARFRGLLQEHFLAIGVDARNRPLGEVFHARGTISSCPVQPFDIFRELLITGASGVVFVHNHPSGDPAPSIEDLRLTERLCKASDLLGIKVLDHVIIGAADHFSFLDAGLLNELRGDSMSSVQSGTNSTD